MTIADLDAHASAIAVRLAQAGGMRLLVADLGSPRDVLSWAIVNGGQRIAATVVWREVRVAELGFAVEAATLMRDALANVSAPATVGLLTARDVRRYERERVVRDGVDAECLATVGLGNLLAAWDPTTALGIPVGTINLICRISVGLTEEALVEACAVAAKARTAAVLAAKLPSPVTGRPATGPEPTASLSPRRSRAAASSSPASTPCAARRSEPQHSARSRVAWRAGWRRIDGR